MKRDKSKVCIAAAMLLVCAASGSWAGVVWQDNGAPACTASGVQEAPYVVSLGASGAIVVWADVRGADYDIYAQRLDANGNQMWTSGGVKICGQPYDQQFPIACDDGAGGAIVAWQDGRLGDDGMEIYAQRIRPDASVAWLADGLPVCAHASGLEDPPTAFSHVVASDGSGGAIVAWRDTRTDPVVANTEVYVQRINGSGAPQWTLNGVKVLGFNALKWATRNPIVTSDGSGGAIVAWQDARNTASTANDLYAQRVTGAGSVAWTANGVVLCNAAGEQGYPDMVDMAGGGAVVVWEDKRSGNYDVYAQRLDPATGSPQWGANGRLICSSANDQRTPRVVSDGASGTIVAWTDKRNSSLYTDVYAQRLSGSGSDQWTAQGVAVCTASGSQARARMCPVSGSSIVTWMDTRNETGLTRYDLFGQILDGTGVVGWNPAGIPIAAITDSTQRMQQAVGDGVGNVYTVWEDDRNAGNWDIYAQRLCPSPPETDIRGAKSLPDGAQATVTGGVVTAVFSGSFYMQDADRCSGIKVMSTEAVQEGDEVTVVGTVDTDTERHIDASSVIPL